MVKIKFIKKNNETVYYHCLPEGKEDNSFDLGINLFNKEIVSNTLNKNNAYTAHAAWKILDIFEKTNNIPQEAVSVWV